MEKVKLDNGREVAMRFDINALADFFEVTGKGLDSLDIKKADMAAIRAACWAACKEGEACEGRELGMTPEQFGQQVTPAILYEMVAILALQISGKKKSQEPPDSPQRINLRRWRKKEERT